MAVQSTGVLAAPAEVAPVLAFDVEVRAVARLSETFVRITFGGEQLTAFNDGGPAGPRDLRVKLMIPSPGHPLPDLSELSQRWYAQWKALDPEVRGWMRTYTVRRARTSGPDPQIDIDFVLHVDENGQEGPASGWASRAEVGDRLTILGPNARCEIGGGIEWRPPVDRPVRVLLVGDEAAVPAIASILEGLPAGYTGHALLEVPAGADRQQLRTAADVEVRWFVRGSGQRGRQLLDGAAEVLADLAVDRVGDVELPEVDIDRELIWESAESPADRSGFYAWIAGEAATVRELRRYLVRDLGVDRGQVAFMGYWREGREEPQ